MATDFNEGVFQPNFAKTTENNQSSNACQSFRINVKAVKFFRTAFPFNLLYRKQIYIWTDLPDFRETWVENLG